MQALKKDTLRALLLVVVMTIVCGLAFPLLMTGVSQLLFRDKANGSIIEAVSYTHLGRESHPRPRPQGGDHPRQKRRPENCLLYTSSLRAAPALFFLLHSTIGRIKQGLAFCPGR